MPSDNKFSKEKERKSMLYDPIKFFNKHFKIRVKVYMRTDKQSGHIPQVIEGQLVAYDPRTGLLIINTKDKHVILDNRGSRSHWEIERGN